MNPVRNPPSAEGKTDRHDGERLVAPSGHAQRAGRLFVALVSATSGALVALLTVAGLFLWAIYT